MTTRKKYTREFKQDAVRLFSEQGYNQSAAARNLGIDRGMLGRVTEEGTVAPILWPLEVQNALLMAEPRPRLDGARVHASSA